MPTEFSFFQLMPEEMIIRILSFLDEDLFSVQQISKQFYNLGRDKIIWQALCKKHFNAIVEPDERCIQKYIILYFFEKGRLLLEQNDLLNENIIKAGNYFYKTLILLHEFLTIPAITMTSSPDLSNNLNNRINQALQLIQRSLAVPDKKSSDEFWISNILIYISIYLNKHKIFFDLNNSEKLYSTVLQLLIAQGNQMAMCIEATRLLRNNKFIWNNPVSFEDTIEKINVLLTNAYEKGNLETAYYLTNESPIKDRINFNATRYELIARRECAAKRNHVKAMIFFAKYLLDYYCHEQEKLNELFAAYQQSTTYAQVDFKQFLTHIKEKIIFYLKGAITLGSTDKSAPKILATVYSKRGKEYYSLLPLTPDIEKEIYYLKQASSLGDAESGYQLGQIYLNTAPYKNAVPYDINEAIKFFTQGAERNAKSGSTECRYALIAIYSSEIAINVQNAEKNLEKMLHCYHTAMEHGEVQLAVGLANLYINGNNHLGLKPDFNKAIEVFVQLFSVATIDTEQFDILSESENKLLYNVVLGTAGTIAFNISCEFSKKLHDSSSRHENLSHFIMWNILGLILNNQECRDNLEGLFNGTLYGDEYYNLLLWDNLEMTETPEQIVQLAKNCHQTYKLHYSFDELLELITSDYQVLDTTFLRKTNMYCFLRDAVSTSNCPRHSCESRNDGTFTL